MANLKHDEKSSESLLHVFTVAAVEQRKKKLFINKRKLNFNSITVRNNFQVTVRFI